MLGQVKVCAVRNAPQFAPAKREQELDISGCVGIMRQLFWVMVTQAQVLILPAKVEQPLVANNHSST